MDVLLILISNRYGIARFYKQYPAELFCKRLVFCGFRYYQNLAFFEQYRAISEIYSKLSFDDHKQFIAMEMLMPMVVAMHDSNSYFVIIELGYDFGRP